MSIQIPQGCLEYPDTEELIEQCHALIDVIDGSEHSRSKEVLFTLLKEKLTILRDCYQVEIGKKEFIMVSSPIN
ncbi:hypothetical protein [Zophobihabitans entericus]|uniref:Uncharacterized protein n=1 Tax=Zophobihabitans entericus TaxID=1635327 RepID=A0A6G9ID75_9GAMM|nr:hypothetical protein [Zophobihabitans entericus]QIQ22188.1 hypothetical protein IPMB12_11115 [Zophobihabitans entericus]